MALTFAELQPFDARARATMRRSVAARPVSRGVRGLAGEPAANGVPPWLLPTPAGYRDGSYPVTIPGFDEAMRRWG